MTILCIVPCGKRKIWDRYPGLGPVRTRDAYIGPLAKLAMAYAEMLHPDHWVILSAKHGFLKPDDIVPGPYDVSFQHPNTHPIAVEELRTQAYRLGLDRYAEIMVLGGQAYVDTVQKVFPDRRICAPLQGKRLGEKLSLLKRAAETGKPLKCSP